MKLYYVSPGRLLTEDGEEIEGIMDLRATWKRKWRESSNAPVAEDVGYSEVQITLLLEMTEDLPEFDVQETVENLIQLEQLLSDSAPRPKRMNEIHSKL